MMTEFDMVNVRKESNAVISKLGVAINPSLPILDCDFICKPQEMVVERLLTLFVVVGVAYGFKKNAAQAWMETENLSNCITIEEKKFLGGKGLSSVEVQYQVESLWALAWSLGLIEKIDYTELCHDDFISVFPDVLRSESSERLRRKAKLRDEKNIIREVDVAYCLHWASVSRKIPSGVVPGWVIVSRRRALEWLVGEGGWDEVQLDT